MYTNWKFRSPETLHKHGPNLETNAITDDNIVVTYPANVYAKFLENWIKENVGIKWCSWPIFQQVTLNLQVKPAHGYETNMYEQMYKLTGYEDNPENEVLWLTAFPIGGVTRHIWQLIRVRLSPVNTNIAHLSK